MPPCRFYQQGNCRYGDSCRFEHVGYSEDESDADGVRPERFYSDADNLIVFEEYVPRPRWPRCLRQSFSPSQSPVMEVRRRLGVDFCGEVDDDFEIQAVEIYTKEASQPYAHINQSLRSHQQGRWVNTIYYLNAFIQNKTANEGTYAGTVFRGLDFDIEVPDEGDCIFFKAFTSTSCDRDVASDFGNKWMFCFSSLGPSADISQISEYPDEQEVLLGPYQQYNVDSVDDEDREIWLTYRTGLWW